jgi:hypothetical protein
VKAVQPVPQRPVGFGIQMPIAVQGEAHRRMPGATSDLLGTSSGGDPQGDRTHPTVRSATAPERAEVSQLPAATSWASPEHQPGPAPMAQGNTSAHCPNGLSPLRIDPHVPRASWAAGPILRGVCPGRSAHPQRPTPTHRPAELASPSAG